MVARLDRRAVEEDFKKCGVPVVPEEVDARCSHLRRRKNEKTKVKLPPKLQKFLADAGKSGS